MRIAILSAAAVLLIAGAAPAAETFVTTTFGNDKACGHPGTLTADRDALRFDLSGLPRSARVVRAVLRFPFRGGRNQTGVKLTPVGVAEEPLPTCPPAHRTLDATAAVVKWAADPAANKGLKIVSRGQADFGRAVLEISYVGAAAGEGIASVSDLKAEHRDGQTFLTWKEPEDVVGADAPTFEAFEKAVLDARARRHVVYRVYRGEKAITPANLGDCQLIREVPEALSCWNLLAIANTEHPQQNRTKNSPLRGGNLVLNHTMTRWKLAEGGVPMPRARGLAVFTVDRPGKRYYAVTVAVDGREQIAKVTAGVNASPAIDETTARFPAIIPQRTVTAAPQHVGASPVDVAVCFVEPPFAEAPRPVEIYMPRWKDLPAGSADKPLPLYVNLATYGCTATELSSPIWHGARRHVGGAVTVALSEEGTLWAGEHECLGTLRGLDEGVVMNYTQRRVLATAAWAIADKDLHVDPERVYVWGQFAGWAIRHGDVFAVVMSNGHNNLKTSREGAKHAWRWGPPGGSRNWTGVNHLDYLDMAQWVRDNPKVELPYWVGWPAYGAFPDHTLGDFGFKPWQDFVTAMQQSKRAFTCVWMSNGPGLAGPFRSEMVPKIKLHQSLPAFTNCSLDTKILTDSPKGEYRPGKYDQDFQKHADKEGGINLHQRWDADTIVDQPARWAITCWLAGPDGRGRGGAPADEATMDLTPRRCRKFAVKPGQAFAWTVADAAGRTVQSGAASADRFGLATVTGIKLTRDKRTIEIKAK